MSRPRGKSVGTFRERAHPTMERFAAIAFFLMKAPRTLKELHSLLGIQYSGNYTSILLDVLRAEGVIYIINWLDGGYGQRWAAQYAWQPSVSHYVDATRPPLKKQCCRPRRGAMALAQPNRAIAPLNRSTEQPSSVSIERD